MRKSKLKRNKKIDKNVLFKLVPWKTILSSTGNPELIWVWTGEKSSLNTGRLKIMMIGYSSNAMHSHKVLAKQNETTISSLPYVGVEQPQVRGIINATESIIDKMVWVDPNFEKTVKDYRRYASRYRK